MLLRDFKKLQFLVLQEVLFGVSQPQTSVFHRVPKQPAGTNNLCAALSAVCVNSALFPRGQSGGESG